MSEQNENLEAIAEHGADIEVELGDATTKKDDAGFIDRESDF